MGRVLSGPGGRPALGTTVLVFFFLGALCFRAAQAAAPVGADPLQRDRRGAESAVATELDGQWVLLMSKAEVDAREEEARQRAAALEAARRRDQAARSAPPAGEAPARDRVASRRRRRRGGSPGYQQERTAGQTYRQKYSSWSCSAASLTIALSLLDRRPADAGTEELVIRKLGSNISHKDGLTGQGMQALADVARNEFQVAARRIESTDDVTRELQAGHPVVLDVHRPISGAGHYVVVAGPGRRPGTMHIKDPAPDGGDFEWNQNTLKKAIRAGGVAVWNQPAP